MLSDLLNFLHRPVLYERTTEKFWTDPHIAAQMLLSHLDPDVDAASFKHEFIDRSVEWIASLPMPVGASLLDIGCGPGLFTGRFAKKGLRATGLDFSENSINYARKHDPGSEYVIADYLALDYDGIFDVVTLINADYGALIPEERRNLLRRVYRALKPGGIFVFDVFTPLLDKGKRDSTHWEAHEGGGFMSPNPHLQLSADYYYGDAAAVCRIAIIEERGVRCFNLWNCYFTRQSLLNEAAPYGFYEKGIYSDAAGKPYADDATRICAVLGK